MEPKGRHWTAALAVALLVHTGALAAAVWRPPGNRSAPREAGAITVSLGGAGVEAASAAQAEPASAGPVTEAMAPPEPAADPAPPAPMVEAAPSSIEVAETVPEESVEEPAADEPAPIEAVTEPETVRDVPPLVEPERSERAENARPWPLPPPAPPRPVPAPAVAATPPPVRPQAVQPRAAPAAEHGPRSVRQPLTASAAPIGPVATHLPPAPDVPSVANAGAAATRAATLTYAAQIQLWLARHRTYPQGARLRQQQGVARVAFTIDRSGRVLRVRLLQATGHELLDNEVMALIRRAQPLPPMPDALTQSTLELVVPVEFSLQ